MKAYITPEGDHVCLFIFVSSTGAALQRSAVWTYMYADPGLGTYLIREMPNDNMLNTYTKMR